MIFFPVARFFVSSAVALTSYTPCRPSLCHRPSFPSTTVEDRQRSLRSSAVARSVVLSSSQSFVRLRSCLPARLSVWPAITNSHCGLCDIHCFSFLRRAKRASRLNGWPFFYVFFVGFFTERTVNRRRKL